MPKQNVLDLKSFFLVLTKKTGTFTQNSLAMTLCTTPKNMNYFVNGGPTAFLKNGFQQMEESVQLSNEICRLNFVQKSKILRTLQEETQLPSSIASSLEELLRAGQDGETEDVSKKFRQLIDEILFLANENQILGSSAKKAAALPVEGELGLPPDFIKELKESKIRQIEEQLKRFRKQQYFESFVREKEVNIHTSRESWEVKHSIEVVVVNLKADSDVIAFPRRILLTSYDTTYSGYREFVERKYRDLVIRVNGKDILDYAKEFKGYETHGKDLYEMAFDIRRKEQLILNQRSIDMDLKIPLKPRSETKIFIRYTTEDDWSFDRNSFVFRMKLPCRYFKYSCKLNGGDNKWRLSLKAFGDLFKKGEDSGNEYLHEDSTSVSIKVNSWILPDTSGFQEIIRYHRDIHKKDLQVDFIKELDQSKLTE